MADNFTFKDASGVNRTARAKDNSSIHLPATVLADELGTLIAADDAAAAGPIFPIAGVYQSTIDTVDAGDIGRIRMSDRRAIISVPDFLGVTASSSSVASAGDLEVSDVNSVSGYVAPNTDFFDGADSSFTTASKFIRFPMRNFNEAFITVVNSLGVNIAIAVLIMMGPTGTGTAPVLFTENGLANGTYVLQPYAVSTGGSNIKVVESLKAPAFFYVIRVTAASDPSGGSISISVNRK